MTGLGWGIGVGAVEGMYLLVSREHRLLREVGPVLQLGRRGLGLEGGGGDGVGVGDWGGSSGGHVPSRVA